MLKFKQKTESEQTYHSPNPLVEPTMSAGENRRTGEEKVAQPLLSTTTGPSVRGIPFARRNLFGIEWGNLLKRGQHRKFFWTRSRKIAAVTLALTGLVGGRWFYANLPPTLIMPPATPATLSGPNAQHFYAAATEALSEEASTKIELAHSTIDRGPRTRESLAERRAAVQAAEPTLTLMRQGFAYQFHGMQTSWTKEQVSPYKLSSPVPNYVNIRTLTRLFAVEASVLAADGKYGAALSASLDAVRFGVDIGQTPTMIAGMIGRLCQDIGGKEALLYVDQLTATEARQAIPRVGQLIENEQTMAQIMESERLVGNATFEEIMTPKAASVMGLAALAGHDNFVEMASVLVRHYASVFWFTNQGVVDSYNHFMDRVIQQASLPYQQTRFPTEAQQKALSPIAELMIPNMGRAHRFLTQTRARNRVLLTQLAVQAYRQEHNGAFPKTLKDLTLGPTPYLTTIPADLFSQSGTDPLRYANGKVYSVGANGKDDGGTGDDTLESER